MNVFLIQEVNHLNNESRTILPKAFMSPSSANDHAIALLQQRFNCSTADIITHRYYDNVAFISYVQSNGSPDFEYVILNVTVED